MNVKDSPSRNYEVRVWQKYRELAAIAKVDEFMKSKLRDEIEVLYTFNLTSEQAARVVHRYGFMLCRER